MSVRIGINGFGRIGRLILRAARGRPIEIVAVNDVAEPRALAHLLRWDSVHRAYPGSVEVVDDTIEVDGRKLLVRREPDPAKLGWGALDVRLVVEASGRFKARGQVARHLEAGARQVLATRPVTGADATIVRGVNDAALDATRHTVVSAGSCTTNCLAPMARVLHERFGIARGWITTVHAYTNDQTVLDRPHKDLRRARAAALAMIPTTTGAADATGLVIPELAGRLDGLAIRVPTPNVSLVDLVADLERDATVEAIDTALRDAADGVMSGILGVVDEPLVSTDFNGDSRSCVVDAPSTRVLEGRLAKLLAWYDNEWAYANRVVELLERIVAETS